MNNAININELLATMSAEEKAALIASLGLTSSNEFDVELKGDKLVITMPFSEQGKPSSTGKTLNHCSTNGNKKTPILVAGKELYIGVNAYTYL